MHDHQLHESLCRLEAKIDHLIKTLAHEDARVAALTWRLRLATDRLSRSVQPTQGPAPALQEHTHMPNQTLDALAAQVAATETVIDSAVTLINGIAGRIQAAVDAAVAGGASAADLAPVTQEVADLQARTQALAAAVSANTPPAP
jgi:uncharacterized coiled-coil protein SlyX